MKTVPVNITSSAEPTAYLRTYIWYRLDENALQIIHLYWTSQFPKYDHPEDVAHTTHTQLSGFITQLMPVCLMNESALQNWHRYLV